MLGKLLWLSRTTYKTLFLRDNISQNEWIGIIYPKVKKHAKNKGVEIFCLDETSIRSYDPLLRTWYEKDKTHVVKK